MRLQRQCRLPRPSGIFPQPIPLGSQGARITPVHHLENTSRTRIDTSPLAKGSSRELEVADEDFFLAPRGEERDDGGYVEVARFGRRGAARGAVNDDIGGNVRKKSRRTPPPRRAEDLPRARVDEHEALAGARDRDVREAALLVDVVGTRVLHAPV